MPIPSLGAINGENIQELIDSLEKQRKELAYTLMSLDSSNVLELNAEVINAGVINAKHIKIGSESTFEPGYDPAGIVSTLDTRFSVIEGDITARVLQTDFNTLTGRVATTESSLSVLPGQIASKVSATDYNGNTVVSMINQTSTTIKLKAENIDLDGIVKVASTLNIGEFGVRSVNKAIFFGGTANIYNAAYTDDLSVSAQNVYITDGSVYIGHSGGIVDFGNAQIRNFTGGSSNAATLEGHPASYFSVNGHVHSDTDYVKPSSGQAIMLGVSTGTKKVNVYVSGSLVGQLTYV